MTPVAGSTFAAGERRWSLAGADPERICNWDGEPIVYNRDSGDTHILDVVSGEIVVALAHAAATPGELAHRVALFLDVPYDDVIDNVRHILNVLEELGLVRGEAVCASPS